MIQSTSQSRENLSGGDENMLPLRCRIHWQSSTVQGGLSRPRDNGCESNK
jgi:hypothetical protein